MYKNQIERIKKLYVKLAYLSLDLAEKTADIEDIDFIKGYLSESADCLESLNGYLKGLDDHAKRYRK